MNFRGLELEEPGLHAIGEIDGDYPSEGFAFLGDRVGDRTLDLNIGREDTAFFMVERGHLRMPRPNGLMSTISTGEFLVAPGGTTFSISPDTRGTVAVRRGYRGLWCSGGPIEPVGRLRYIDGCTDSLLVHPQRIGDPCLNHLHFPPNIDQTMHTHPSVRFGSVMRGRGVCVFVDDDGVTQEVELKPGMMWIIPPHSHHKFRTEPDSGLDVIAYHPDSDWGPEDEVHPMLNRTLVDGVSIDNTTAQHQIAAE